MHPVWKYALKRVEKKKSSDLQIFSLGSGGFRDWDEAGLVVWSHFVILFSGWVFFSTYNYIYVFFSFFVFAWTVPFKSAAASHFRKCLPARTHFKLRQVGTG